MTKPSWSFKDVLSSVPKTEPPSGLIASVVKRLPIDTAAKAAKRANDRVVVAEGDVERAKIALEQVIAENAERLSTHQAYLVNREKALEEANEDLVKAQLNFMNEAKEAGALERTGPLLSFLAAIEEQSKGDGK
ncbi:hypothetical protein [Hyphomicrobium sp. MC1]|uniref:hypothetical protein n=1 Tax=Hyphomicrobium sp. (strain MC1) TaxID=717785 RepID=UPI000213DA92|nr:hypothetical protein [Hyphomicrobium sp. MC1]CCB64439.1 protein of unknown function [Hyphomicrobium sp. MC1]